MPNSSSVDAPSTSEPTIRIDRIGRSVVIDVFNDRISTWFSDRFAMSV